MEKSDKNELRSPVRYDKRDVVAKTNGKNAISCKCVLKGKIDADVIARRYNGRFVVCGNRDNEELTNKFAPIVTFSIVVCCSLTHCRTTGK